MQPMSTMEVWDWLNEDEQDLVEGLESQWKLAERERAYARRWWTVHYRRAQMRMRRAEGYSPLPDKS